MNRQRSLLVESTLSELLKRNQSETESDVRTVHVLLFHHLNGIEQYVQSIQNLHNENTRVIVCPDEEVLKHYTINELVAMTGTDDFYTLERLEAERESITELLIPALPFSTVSDILNFNDIRASIRLILWTLMSGRKVIANSQGADPFDKSMEASGLNHGTMLLKRRLNEQLRSLKGFGVELIDDISKLANSVKTKKEQSNTKTVLTAEKVQQVRAAGETTLFIDNNTIITPLARDVAKQYGITLEKARGG